MKHLETPAGRVPLPAFFPDATYGAIRAGSFEDVYRGGLYGCEMNSYHLMTKPGAKLDQEPRRAARLHRLSRRNPDRLRRLSALFADSRKRRLR